MTFFGGALTDYLSDKTTADAIGLDAAINSVRVLGPGRDVYVQVEHSVASATVGISVILHSTQAGTAPIGIALPGAQTATAATLRDAAGSGNYWSGILIFDGADAPFYEVRITTAPSSGNVDVRCWAK